jgi:hypothetical protein
LYLETGVFEQEAIDPRAIHMEAEGPARGSAAFLDRLVFRGVEDELADESVRGPGAVETAWHP